jgi:hypothetical protein
MLKKDFSKGYKVKLFSEADLAFSEAEVDENSSFFREAEVDEYSIFFSEAVVDENSSFASEAEVDENSIFFSEASSFVTRQRNRCGLKL